MKQLRSSASPFNRTGFDSSPPPSTARLSPCARRSLAGESDRSIKAEARTRNLSPNRRKVLNVETQRRVSNEGVDSRRVSPVHSPKISSRRNAAGQMVTGGSPRMTRMIDPKVKILGGAEDDLSTLSENSFSTSSLTDTDTEVRYKLEEYREGRNLLDRCDKLLNSIAKTTAASELQPSPVSVLDSSFYKNEWCSPSPITKRKRCIDYKGESSSAIE